MRRTRAALLLAALLVATAHRAAPAQESGTTGAAELFRLGKEAYDRQEYARAAELFTRCHARSGDPSLLFNIAQAERLAGDCAAAAGHYRRFLAEVPQAKNRADAEAKLADMERCAESQRSAAAAAAPPPVAPSPAVVALAPDRDSDRDREPARSPRTGLWIAGGGGVVLAASAIFWYRAWDADRELDQLFADGGVYDDHHQALADRLDRDRTLAIVTGAVGAAAVAGGLVYHFALRPRRAEPARAALGVTPGGAMLVVGCEL